MKHSSKIKIEVISSNWTLQWSRSAWCFGPALESHLFAEARGDVGQVAAGAYLHQHLGTAQLLRVLAGVDVEGGDFMLTC